MSELRQALTTKPDLAAIVRGSSIVETNRLSPTQKKAFGAIAACRTPKLGGQRFSCDDCGFEKFVYHSCRHRACPKCQTQARQKWVNDRKAELLPVPYFHLVFTLPHSLNPLIGWAAWPQQLGALARKAQCRFSGRMPIEKLGGCGSLISFSLPRPRLSGPPDLLNLLFHAASRTLLEFGESRLGGKLGVTMVLHTWTQQLQSHYHVHCVVPAGALSADGTRWQAAGRKFLFPVHALSKVFRAKYAEGVAALLKAGEHVDIPPHLSADLSAATNIDRWIHRNLMSTKWVVYCKSAMSPTEDSDQRKRHIRSERQLESASRDMPLLEYLSLYTHRTAIGNERILSYDGDRVRFRWKDRRDDDAVRTSTLPADEFLMRFASHILPDRFMRVRHFGLLANRGKTERLNLCRRLMGHPPREAKPEPQTALQWLEDVCGLNESICPCCQLPLRVRTLPKVADRPVRRRPLTDAMFNDSS